MARVRTNVHPSQWRGGSYTLEEKAALAEQYGYDGFDCGVADLQRHAGGDMNAVRDCLAKHKVELASVTGVLGAPLFAADAEWEAAIRQVGRRASIAVAAGGTYTNSVIFNRAVQPKEELWPQTVRRLRQVAQELDGAGVRLGIKYLGVRSLRPERPYVFVQSLAEILQLFQEAQAPRLGLIIDAYHWYAAGDSLEAIRQLPAERLVAFHLSDAKDIPLPDLQDQERLLPGEGAIPLKALLQAALDAGFDGFDGLEVLGPRVAAMDAATYLQDGMAALRTVLPHWRGLPNRSVTASQ